MVRRLSDNTCDYDPLILIPNWLYSVHFFVSNFLCGNFEMKIFQPSFKSLPDNIKYKNDLNQRFQLHRTLMLIFFISLSSNTALVLQPQSRIFDFFGAVRLKGQIRSPSYTIVYYRILVQTIKESMI